MGFCGSKDDAMSVKKGVLLNTCFVDVLNMIPHALLALICIFILTVWNHSVMGKIHVKTWVHLPGHNIRWIATLALIFLNIVQIAEGVISDSYDPDTVNYHTFIPQCIATVGTVVSIVFYHNVEMWNSPKFLLVLMIYWPSAITLKALKAFSLYKNDLTLDYLKPWLLWLAILAYLVIFTVELNVLRVQRYYFFKRPRLQQPPEDLEHTRYTHSYVNFLSKAVFWWITDLMVEGYKNPLQSEDLGRLPESEQAQTQFKKLMFAFEEEKFKATQKNRKPSLIKTYLRAFWPMLLLAALYRLLGDSLSFVGPVIIQYIVDYAYDVTDPEYHRKNNTIIHGFPYVTVDQFMWNGYVLAVVLFLATVLQHTLLQNHNYLVYREGIRLRTGIQTLVYDKALRLSTMVISKGKMTIGQMMNHMIVDSMFLMHMFFFIHYIWSIPFQVVVALILLYFKLGVSAVIGGMFVILCGPLIYLIGIAMSRLQKKVLVHSDSRVKKVNELINGIKAIKLLAWEDIFAKSIDESRQSELHNLFPLLVIRALIGFLGMAAPAIGAILTFIIYPYLEGAPLTAGRTFSTLAIFNLLSTPLQLLTIFAASFANAKVSGARLVPYLLAQEVEGAHIAGGTKTQTHSMGIDTEEETKQESFVQYDVQTGLPLTTLTKDEAFCSSQSSLGSHISHTPGHSRQNSGTSLLDMFDNKRLSLTHNSSSEYLSVKPLALARKSSAPLIGALTETTADRRRKRNHSGFSIEEDDDVADEFLLIELRSVIEISHGNFSWDLDNQKSLCLQNVNIKVPVGKLTVIVGSVGAGKSSLLAAMLGEMVTVSGTVEWKRDTGISYAGQRPWLLNASLRDNVLFGNPYIWRRYKKIISACALNQDIDTLMAADLTEIGEKGVTLSGGQKQRVCLARAIYADADTVILDDPFSALDAHVGRHVFEEAIMRRLIRRKRTVILVTHQLQYIGHASQVIVMKDGEVQYHGRPGDVKKYDQDLYDSWRKAIKDNKPADLKVSKEPEVDGERKASWTTERPASVQSNLSLPMFSRQVSRSQMSVMTEASNEDRNEEENGNKSKPDDSPEEAGKLIKKEHREEGAVVAQVYMYYFRACCVMLCLLTLLLQILHHSLMVSANFSLSVWASDANRFELNLTHHPVPSNATQPKFDSTTYVKTYAALSLSAVFGALIAAIILYFTGLQATRSLFRRMLNNVIHLRMRFFDTNPSGRILNRFTADVTAVDQKLAASFEGSLRCFLYTLAAIVINSITTPFFLFAAVPLIILYYFLQRFFRNTARELQRLDSVTKSPVFAHFGETLAGLQTVRAFRCQKAFRRKAFATIDSNVAPFLYIHTINRWLGIRLDYLGCLLVFVSAIASLSAGALGNSNPAFIGLCLTYALMISGLLNWLVRMTTEVEMNMNAVERIQEYSEMDTELHKPEKGIIVSESWPEQGRVEFNEVCLRYDKHLEDVISHITFSIKGGEKTASIIQSSITINMAL